jgi:hypothetical protein
MKKSTAPVPVSGSMFDDASERRLETPFFKVENQPQSGAPFKPVTMESAFYGGPARTDAVFIIRTIANQYARDAQTAKAGKVFLENISNEISMKAGELDTEIASRNSLMNKFLGK